MAAYNIIYTSANDGDYLWNGSGFDKISNDDNEHLLYSGPSYTDEELANALNKCREAVELKFPGDDEIKLKKIEVHVSSANEAGGHTPHIIS